MKIHHFRTALVLGLIFFIGLNKSNATHVGGSEVFYRWVQDSTYEFTFIYYRTCQPPTIPEPPIVATRASAPSINQNPVVFNCLELPAFGPGVPPVIPKNLFSCLNPAFLCYEEYVYRGMWTSPQRAADWKFTFDLCCFDIQNAPTNVAANTLWIECGLNNLDFPDAIHKNRSPIFHNRRPNHPGYLMDTLNNPPFFSVCEGRLIHLSQAVRNYDQDNIKYEMFIPQTNNGVPNTYINGYSFSNPMPTRNGLGLDTTTGMMNFIPGSPTGNGIYQLGIKATEYRNDTVLILGVPTVVKKEIGFVKRNLFLSINDSATCPDTSFQFKDSTASAATNQINLQCDDNPFKVEFKRYVLCNSIDSNASHILLLNALTLDTINIVKSYSNECSTSFTTNGFSVYLDSALKGGNYYLIFKQGDDGNTMFTDCYKELTAFADTLSISVTPEEPIGVLLVDTLVGSADTIELECFDQNFSVFFTEEFKCNSLASDASDFLLYNLANTPPTIVQLKSAQTIGTCVSGMRSQVNLKTSQFLNPGDYRLTLVQGTDGNSLLTYCGENFDTSAVIIKVNELSLDLGPDITYCKNSDWDTTLKAPLFAAYWWSSGSFSDSITINTAGTYWLTVYAVSGCSKTDTIDVFEKDCYIGINENNSNTDVHVYPNPSTGMLYLEMPNSKGTDEVILFDLNGRIAFHQILEPSNNLSEINLNELKGGIYFLKLTRNGEILKQEKLVLKGY